MTAPVERLLAKLPSAKRNGRGWMARCPAHDDRRPSLSIAEGDDGRALIRCHAGCPVDAICAALGLTLRDLMADDAALMLTKPRYTTARRGCVNVNGQKHGGAARSTTTYATARDAVAALEKRLGKRSAIWTYHDASGEPVGVIVRWGRKDGKDIRPVSRRGLRWIVGAMPTPRPLYRLPDLTDAPRVYVTEGEKAADAARSVGLIATTSAHGSNSANKTDWTPLAGKECVLLPDNDDAGQHYADEVAAILATLTPASVVKVVELPDLPPGGDMADLVAARGAGR